LKQGKGIEESASEHSKGFCIKAQVLDEVGGHDRVGNTMKHGEDIEGGENDKDQKRSGGLRGGFH